MGFNQKQKTKKQKNTHTQKKKKQQQKTKKKNRKIKTIPRQEKINTKKSILFSRYSYFVIKLKELQSYYVPFLFL